MTAASIAQLQRPDPQHPEWQRAFTRALARFGQVEHRVEVTAVGRDDHDVPRLLWLAVPSWKDPDHTYAVTWFFDEDGVLCECDAGAAGRPCWHAALVWLYFHRGSTALSVSRTRIALNSLVDPAGIERERARIEAARLGGVLA